MKTRDEVQHYVAKMRTRGYLERLNARIEGMGKNPTRKGPICQARIDGWNAAVDEILNNI